MDPNEALLSIRRSVAAYLRMEVDNNTEIGDQDWDIDNIVENFQALDGWLTKGGFLPNDWQNPDVRN